jgi:hypothetical protein
VCAFTAAIFAFTTFPVPGPAETTSPQAAKTTNTLIPPPRRDVPGKRFSASLGSLYVPDFFREDPVSTGTPAVVFFHGAAWCSEQNFFDARKNAVLISISLKDYAAVFRDPGMLRQVLDAASEKLADEGVTSKPVTRLCLASFSGGYTALREILRQEQYRPMITDVVLADSLYAPRVEGTTDTLEPGAMAPFLDFAQRAARDECTFFFSHLYPPEEQHRGNTTTLTAGYLIDRVGARRAPASARNSRGARLLYRADRGNFHVLGYAGMTTQDHFEHFYALCDLLRETTLPDAEPQ